MNNTLEIRSAKFSDLLFLFELKNERVALKFSKSKVPVSIFRHALWLFSVIVLNSKSHYLFIAEFNRKKIGLIHFSQINKEHEFEISINLKPFYRGKNLGSHFLELSENRLILKVGACTIIAYIIIENMNSIKFFKKNRYIFDSESNGVIKFTKLLSKIA